MARNHGPSLMDYRRQLMAVQEPEQKWYSGNIPTKSEVTARIYTIGQQNKAFGEQLWNNFQQLQARNDSPWKNPYEQATSMAVKGLSDLGFDMSKGINQDWLQQNSWLQQYYRTGDTSMTPLSPSSKSTPQEDAAYWWYKAYNDEANTQKAENEWKALQEEIGYWTNRSDRNLSDDEILGKIDWNNYKTLSEMDKGIETGVPLSLNRAVGYSKDALKGVIWAARNNGGSGNSFTDSVYAALGVGNQYQKNEEISRKLDPRSEDYSPYSVGSTIDDAALYFGVSDFGPNWLQENRDVLAGNDATAKKFYNQVYKAEETTRKAEEELQSLWNDIDSMLKRNYTDPDKILNGLLDDYSTLKKMDESRKSGSIMDTTRAIDYRWEDVEAEVRRRCAEEQKKDDAPTCASNINNRFNVGYPQTTTDAAVKDSQNKTIQAFATYFPGTPEEMIAFEFAQDAGYEQAVTGIHDAVVNGEVNPAKDYEYAFQNADKKAAGSFFKAQKAMTPYLELQAEIDELKRDRDYYFNQIDLDSRLYDYEVLSQYETPFNPHDTINIHGLQYSVAADFDPETGKFNQEDVTLLPTGGEHSQETDAYAQNVAQRWAAENGSGTAVLKIGDLNFLMQNNSGDVSVSRIREQDAESAAKVYPVMDATKEIDEETQAAIDQWMGNLPDFSQLGGKGNNRHLTADELNDYREYLNFVEHDIKNKEEMLGTIQKDYDDAKAELDAIDLAYQNASDLAEMNGISPSSFGSIYPVLQYGWELYSNPSKREFPTISGYDFALQEGADYEAVADTAYQDIKASQDELKAIEYALGRMEESGMTLDRDMLKAFQNRKDELDRNIKGAQYFLLRGSDDFMEVAEAKRQEILNGWNDPTITDVDRQAVDYETYADIHGGSMAYDISLTEEEWNEYLYILEKSGREAAMDYYNFMTNPDFGIIHNRNMEALQERTKNLVDSGFLGGAAATAMAVISAPAQLGGAAYTLLSWLQGKDPNPNNPTYAVGVFNQTTKAAAKNDITKFFGEGSVGAWLANLGYDAITTAGESLLNAQTFGAVMPQLGNVFASNFLSAMPMGLEAAGNEAREVYLRGGSREQAMAMFGVSLMAETLTETITYGNIKEAMNLGGEEGAKTLKQLFVNALKDGFLDEAPGEAISEALESGLDTIIMGRLSNYQANVDAYIAQGYQEDDAREMATKDALKDIAYAGLLGAVSGVSSTTVANLMSGGLTEAVKIQILAAGQGMSASNFVAQMNQQMGGEQVQNTLATPQQEAPQAPVGEVAGPPTAEQMQQQQEAQRKQTELEQTTKKISALSEALEGNKSAQSAAVAAALVPDGVDENGLNTASAAAQHLMSIYGENTIPIVQNVLLAAQKAGMTEPITTALVTGALSNGATAQALAQITPTTQMTPAVLGALVQRAQADMQNPDIMNGIRQTVADNMIAQEEKNLVAQGAANGNAPYEQAVTQAKQKEADAKDSLDKANADMEAASKEVDNLYQQVEQNPGDDATVAELNRAITALQGKAAVVNEYEQSVVNAENATKQAQDNLSRKQDETNTAIRQQAQENVAQKQQALAEQKAVQEEQRMMEQQAAEQAQAAVQDNNNIAYLDAESFIENVLGGDVTEEERQQVIDRFRAIQAESVQEPVQRNTQLVNQISKKFGIDIVFGDTTNGGVVSRQNGYYDRGAGRIVLDENATVGDALNFVLGHELTHVAEQSGTYNDLATALLRMRYGAEVGDYGSFIRMVEDGSNRGRAAADVLARQQLYNNRLTQMHEQDNSIDATPLDVTAAAQEVVADIMGDILGGNEEMINQLAAEEPSVARRILDGIKNFLKKLVGMDGPWKSDMQRAVDMLENALKESNQSDNGGVKYKLTEYSDAEKNDWSNSRTIVLYDGSRSSLEDFINSSLEKPDQFKKMYFGKIDPALATRIRNETGVETEGLNLTLRSYEVVKILEHSHGDATKESSRGQTPITPNEILEAIQTIENPDTIEKGVYKGGGSSHDAITFTKNINGKVNAFTYVVSTKHDLVIQTIYKNVQKRSMASAGDANSPLLNTSETNRGTASGISLQQNQGVVKPIIQNDQGTDLADELRGGTVVRGQDFSLSSWTKEEQERVRKELINRGFAEEDVNKWIDDTNGVASMIAADRSRLDFTADPTKTMLKPNAEYVKTLDASTLCAKRLVYQGTFDAIQHALPNTPLMPTDLIDLANMMREMGYEAPCGICYVESRRRNLGKFASQWLEEYDGSYKPTLDQVTTTDGLEELRTSHPDTYQDFVSAMNKKGTMNPKVVQLRTDYRGEISEMTPAQIQKVKDIGGLRVQSFSDFETPHLLDMMQAVMDMASAGLTSQAYTKVPNFAWVFGDTGIKINLSLIGAGTGLDADGNLAFDNVEGMNFEEAMKLRERYSKNVGTILVGINDEHILAAMADPRIDFIIPFHKSGWSSEELDKMPVLNSYSDYTSSQNEKKIIGKGKGGYKTESLEKSKRVNFQPVGENGYWDFNKSGKENAETYLRMCAEDGRLPKFSQFLVDNGDGSFSLQPDGSTDGYWKTLIDFKMYDNEGNGSPQQEVTPNVNMEEAVRVLNEFDGRGVNSLPVAQPVVDRYVEEYKENHPLDENRIKYSLPSNNELDALIRNYLSNGGMLSTNTTPPGNTLPGPVQTGNQGTRQRQFGSKTAQESNALHDEVKQYLKEHSGYNPDTNHRQINDAISWVQSHATANDTEGYFGAIEEASSSDFDYMSADGQAKMLTLMSMAALKGDVATEVKLADMYNKQGTEIGRTLQARQIFRMMTPLGRVGILNNEVNRINQQYIEAGSKTRVKLSDETLKQASDAKTGEDFERVRKKAYKELAEQMPPTWKEKLQSWRMLSMLGNPRTHVRNILGNAIFMPAVKLKNVIGTGLESMFLGKGETRTKSLMASKENRSFAKQDAIAMKDVLTNEAKYNPEQKIQQARKMFGQGKGLLSRTIGKALEGLSDFNSWALEAEDWVFLQKHYTNALSGWMQANKLTPETITEEQLQQGRLYAIDEAQKATYRDASEIANLFSKISRNGGVTGWVVDAVLPFKKTPANILKRGIEYSPVGVIRTLMQGRKGLAQYNAWANGEIDTLPKNAMSPTQFIDKISAGLSGTAITALGALLASMGVVNAGFGDDDDMEELQGKQEYALNFSLFGQDISYTIDWAAPVCMPFFVGASIYENLSQDKEGMDVGELIESMLEITEPVFNLSMLDGVNSLLSVNTFSGGNALTEIGEKVAANYVSSYIPTVVGQASRIIDPVRRKSYVESGASLSTWRYALEQAENKTPYSVTNIPYRNPWGEEDRSDTWLAAFENLVSPGYISTVNSTDLEKELSRLYDATGENVAVPKLPSKSVTVAGETIKLNAEQYDQYTKSRGTTAKSILEDMIGRPDWVMLSDPDKVKLVDYAWTYANQTSRAEQFPNGKVDIWVSKAQASGDPVSAMYDKYYEAVKDDTVKSYKTALLNSIDDGNTESALTCVQALVDAGQEESSIKSYLTRNYKPEYIAAYNANDYEKMNDIEFTLRGLGLGYKAKEFKEWLK